MALLSALISFFHILLLLLVPPLTFLWIIGKLKAIRLQRTQQHIQLHHQQPLSEPSPSSIPLQPRRLSFSSAATTNTPTPTQNPKRRVTFSLTPEQQANELLKTAVRRRESLPSANLLLPNQSPPPQYNPPPHEVAHLFPSQFHHNSPHDPAAARYDSRPSNPSSSILQKNKTSLNNNKRGLLKRQQDPTTQRSRAPSQPIYAADLRREPQQTRKRSSHTGPLQFKPLQPQQEDGHILEHPKTEPRNDKLTITTNAYRNDSRVLHAFVRQVPGHKQPCTPPSDKKPPRPPISGTVSNGFTPQPLTTLPQDRVTAVRRNGLVSRSVR